MYQATLTVGQTSAPQAAGVGCVAKLTISSGSGYVQYTTGSFADITNNVATWTTWPKGTVSSTTQDTVGSPVIVRFVCVTGTVSVMLADPSESEYPSNALIPWESMQASYAYDSAGNVAGLVGLGADIGNNVLLIGTATRSSGDEKVAIEETNTNPDADARPVLTRVDQVVDPAAGGTIDWHALDVRCYGGGANARAPIQSGRKCSVDCNFMQILHNVGKADRRLIRV